MNPLQRSYFPILLLAALLIGCASLGILAPQTLDERLSYAYDQHTAALQTITSATNQKLIGSRDATSLLAIADQSRTLLDAAKLATSSGDIKSAEGRLVLATNVLRELQTYLRSRAQGGAS